MHRVNQGLPLVKAGLSRLSRNQEHAPRGRSRRPHAEVDRSSARFDCRPQFHPTECLFVYSTSALVDLHQLQSCVLVPQQTGGSCPRTAQLSGQPAAPAQPCPDGSSPLAESVPTPRRHGGGGSRFVLEHLRLRKTPANMSFKLEKVAERCVLHWMRR